MVWSALATKLVGTLLAAYGFGLITPIHWSEIALIWGYSIVMAFFTDWVKTRVYRPLNLRGRLHEQFLQTVHHHLAPHSIHGGTNF